MGTHTSLVLLPALLAAVVTTVAACDKKIPTQPDQPPSSISIVGSTALQHPGEASQLRAMATFIDGSTRDVTGESAWSADDHAVVTFKGRGVLTATWYGRTKIAVTHYPKTMTADVSVVPHGMALIRGVVNVVGGFALWNANVSVTLPDGAVIRTTTNGDGEFVLPGFGNVVLRADKESFITSEQQMAVDGDVNVTFELRDAAAPDSIQGSYTLTVTASPSCELPADIQQRRFVARIWEHRNGFSVNVDSAGGEPWPVGFTGVRAGNSVRFDILDKEENFGDLAFAVRLDSTRVLAYAGTATGTIGEGSIAAVFDGLVQLLIPGAQVLAECRATDHRLDLVRLPAAGLARSKR